MILLFNFYVVNFIIKFYKNLRIFYTKFFIHSLNFFKKLIFFNILFYKILFIKSEHDKKSKLGNKIRIFNYIKKKFK